MRRPLRTRLVGWLLSAALRLQALTWRKRLSGIDRLDSLLAARSGAIAVFWHGKYAPLFVLLRAPGAVIFTSRSFRGDVISEVCRRFGFRAVEIADHGGDLALTRMRDALASAALGAIAVDGPLGPYHEVKRGAIELASDLGFPLLPISVASRRKRVAAERWDRMELPRVFTTVCLEVGEPISVPRGLDEDGVERFAQAVHAALDAIDARLDAAVRTD